MAGNRPEERVRTTPVRQSWRTMTFLHWPIDPAIIQSRLPEGLVPDVIDGSAWVGLTPFRLERFRLLGGIPLPPSSTFPETNLRTYVRDRQGRDGLWFFSLDVSNPLNVVGGRVGGVPYHWSAMSVSGTTSVRYRCDRRLGPPARHDITIRPGAALPDDDPRALAGLLAGRWRAYVRYAGRLVVVPVEHQPWPLRSATIEHLDETLTVAAGLPRRGDEPLVHFSDGVDASLGLPARAVSG